MDFFGNITDLEVCDYQNCTFNESSFITSLQNNGYNEAQLINNSVELDTLIFNISKRDPLEYATPIYGYIMPFLLFLTITTNTLVVIVLSKKHMRSPTNLVLMGMALSDTFTMGVPSPWLFYLYTLGNHYKPLPVTACYAYIYMVDVIPASFHTASIWLTVALAVQRYVYVCHPVQAKTWCTIPKVIYGTIVIYAISFLYQIPRFFDQYFYGMLIPWKNSTKEACVRTSSAWLAIIGEDIFYNIYFWFRVLFIHVIPCSSLVILNVLLLKAMREAHLKRKKLLQENRKSESKKLRESNCTTLMLIAVVSVFLLVEVPMAVVIVLHIIHNTFQVEVIDYHITGMLILFINFIIMFSYPINFAIYCGMSKQFRMTFKELFVAGENRRMGSTRYSYLNGPRTSTNETVL